MSKSVTRIVALVALGIALGIFFGGQFDLVMNPQPGSKATQGYSMARDLPDRQYYILVGLCSIMLLPLVYFVFVHKRWLRMATSKSISDAQKVCLTLWRVEGDVGIFKTL